MVLTVELFAIILSIVAFIVTILGFFASLKFYRDGVNLQNNANDALTKMVEKTDSIQYQIKSIIDKTLDAAINKREDVSEEFEALQHRLEESASQIMEGVSADIQGLGKEKRDEIVRSVKEEFSLIEKQLSEAKEIIEQTQTSNQQIPKIFRTSNIARKILISLLDYKNMTPAGIEDEVRASTEVRTRRLDMLERLGYITKSKTEDSVIYSITPTGVEIAKILKQFFN